MNAVTPEWLMFNRKSLLGKYLVEFNSWGDTSIIKTIGKIIEVIVNDSHLQIRTDGEAWFAIGWDTEPKPRIEMVESTIFIDHIGLGIRYQIVMGK